MAAEFFVPFGVCFFVFCILERVLHIVLSLFTPSHSKKGSLGAQIVIGSVFNVAATIVSNTIAIFVSCLNVLGWLTIWFLIVFCLCSLWYVIYEEFPQVVWLLVGFYNNRVGPFIHTYLLFPVEIWNVMFKGFVPVFNGAAWIVRSVLGQGLLPIAWNEFSTLIDLGAAFLRLGMHTVDSLVGFLKDLECAVDVCLQRPAVLDVVSPMDDVRLISALFSKLLGNVCYVMSIPADLVLYPLRDLHFATGLHSLANSVIHLFVHVPMGTLRRCDMYGTTGAHTDVLMCTPDLEPVFTHLVSGIRDMGSAVDNWMGIGASMARRSLTGVPDSCTVKTLSPDSFRADGLLDGAVSVVGMTDWLMAATNGSMAYFFGQVNTDVAPRQWPSRVDVRMGVAAVSYSEVNEMDVSTLTQGRRPGSRQTTTMMGCRCEDGASGLGIRVRCHFLPMSGVIPVDESGMDVWFQDQSWVSKMTCSTVEISVRSVRWPVRRYEGKSVPFGDYVADMPNGDCLTQGTCEKVDATIWLVPRCDLLPAVQCSDVAVGTSCFPFCMAARISGSKNANPVFTNAETWRTGKQLLMRDCVTTTGGQTAVSEVLNRFFAQGQGVSTTQHYGQTSLAGAAGDTPLFVRGSGATCGPGVDVSSWVPKTDAEIASDGGKVLSYIRRTGQPFAIAGDTILLEYPQSDGGTIVEVERLTGDQKDEYTLRKGWYGLPAAPKRLVPIKELDMDVQNRIVVPMEYSATRIMSTSSRNFMFYAVNPDLQIFEAYLDYCSDRTKLPRIQVMALSSYSPLRIYRVRAYCQENCNQNWTDIGRQYTFDSFSDGKFTADTFQRDCGRTYNASIDSLEYVNEQNIAVVVQVADSTYKVSTRSGAGSTYLTYWLNPATMAVKNDSMWTSNTPTSLSVSLCAAGDSVPHLGTLAAEVVAAGVYVVKLVAGAFVYTPGLIFLWKGGGVCPLASRGHSVLASCGESVYDLEDFFDSLDDATAVFWGIPIWLADQLQQGNVVDYSPMGDLLQGMGIYGKSVMGITDVRSGILSLLNTPLAKQTEVAWAIIRNPGALAWASSAALSGGSLARYTSRVFIKLGVGTVKSIVTVGPMTAFDVWSRFIGVIYDLRPFFKSSVTDRAQNACLGLQVMIGGANPWGRLLYNGCKGSSALLDGTVDLFIHMLVDAPMVKCVCKDSVGHVVGAYVRDNCISTAPKTMVPVVLGMVSASEGNGMDSLLCPAVIEYTRNNMVASMTPWFGAVYASLDALGDSIDYMLVGFDEDAGQCMNFQQDPQIVVIMPEPVDYFRGCGATTSCHTKCSGTWTAFKTELAKRNPESLFSVKTIEHTSESMFFPTPGVNMVAPGTIVALSLLDACPIGMCRDSTDGGLAVAYISELLLHVTYYCIPRSLSLSVYTSDAAGTLGWESTVGFDASQIGFLDSDGTSMVALVRNELYFLQRGRPPTVVVNINEIFILLLINAYPMQIIGFVVVRDKILVNVAVRVNSDDMFQRISSTIWVDPKYGRYGFPAVIDPPIRDFWSGYAVSEYPSSAQLSSARGEMATLFLWPVTPTGFIQRVRLSYGNSSVSVMSIDPFVPDESLVAQASLMPRKIVLSKMLRVESGKISVLASSGNTYDWLQQMRLYGNDLELTKGTLGNSQEVGTSVSITTECNGIDCRGCLDLGLRSMCAAYQSCAVFRCIGTPVNLKRPLCGIGQVLRTTGLLAVDTYHGAWVTFVDIYMILLQLSTQPNIPGIDVSFPEDNFYDNICNLKDLSTEFFGILSSTVNTALQRAQVPTISMSNVAKVDSNANTALSMSTAALTGFLSQIAMLPIYIMAVEHKITMCQVSGVLLAPSALGFHVNIAPASFSSVDAIGGQCLFQGADTTSTETGDPSAVNAMFGLSASLLSMDSESNKLKRIEPLIHAIDGGFAYLIGITGKFADLLQAFDLKQCVLPDVTLKNTVRCACGDSALSISPTRKSEGISEFAYWCTGTISLVDASNRVRVVWNPYTYQQLQDKLNGVMDAYVNTASASNVAEPPTDQVFVEQGVSMIAVLTRCRQNYVNHQWDPSAYVQYSQDMVNREVMGGAKRQATSIQDGVGGCLMESSLKGVGNGACLDAFLASKGATSDYWSYAQTNATESNLIDACLVFSGPASNASVSPARRKVFQDCLSGYSNGNMCDISGFIWSPSSSNDVPVASRHVINAGPSATLDAVVQRMAAASKMVVEELDKLKGYNNTDLEAAMFSSEGDVIHQLMDCVFMGPYARMDYWPAPRCNETTTADCLVGPYWSRDTGGGSTRKVDIETCPSSDTLPFTCGSPTRRAMVKDFVQRYMEAGQGGSEVLLGLVRVWLRDLRSAWGDVSALGCDCPAGSPMPNDVSCCKANADSHLPTSLAKIGMYLPTRGVLNAMETRMHVFYQEALWSPEAWTTHLNASEKAKYDWISSAGAHRVEIDALYDTTKPTREYAKSEAINPPRSLNNPGLWHTCHGAIRQILFNIPVLGDGALRDAVPIFAGGGADAIAAHVSEIVKASFESSPLFRHYQPRHHPSESLMCEDSSAGDSAGAGTAHFGDYVVDGNLIFDGRSLAGIPVLGFDTASIGKWNRSCFCGWRQISGRCTVPVEACAGVKSVIPATAGDCTYAIGVQNMRLLESAYRPGTDGWPCPLLELSEHLGFLDPLSTEKWITGDFNLTTSGEFILRYGPGGIKIGNAPGSTSGGTGPGLVPDMPLGDIAQVLRQYLTPSSRTIDPNLGVVRGCKEHQRERPESLLESFVETLFPMAHGVSESGVGSYCLRFALEMARLRAMELLMGADHTKLVQQKNVLARWRRRCGSQVQLVGMCSALDVYHHGGTQPAACLQPWEVIMDPSVEMYVTPQCLVNINGVFYDPCGCNPAWCEQSYQMYRIGRAELESPECRVKFDPRSVVRASEMGWWGADETIPEAAAANEWLENSWNLLDMDRLKAEMLNEGQSVGNTPSGHHWATAEGFMSENAVYCDMIADYWPESWMFPVGYHVTVPCNKEDAGYRSFSNVFAQDSDRDVDGVPVLVYLEDQTRDGELVDSHFGVGGMCRGTNFGFDMYETNTMRVCTKISDGEDVDVHVPAGQNGQGGMGEARCSSSSTELPWADERYYTFFDSAFYSVGTVPSLPTSGAKAYPESPDRYMKVGPQHEMEMEQWGSQCQDFAIPNCSLGEWVCPTGFVCRGGGVCQHASVECTRHDECSDGRMCSGVGTCETPRITVENDEGVDASFRAHTTQCAGERFSMRGGSSWGYVPDLLQSHGMCSYRHWQEYLYTLGQCNCGGSNPEECILNGTACRMYKFSKTDDSNMWWNMDNQYPNRLKMLPTTCDRDYERFSMGGLEMFSCVPGNDRVRVMKVDNTYQNSADRDKMWKTYNGDSRTVTLLRMPFRTNVTFGFLGFAKEPMLKSCTSVQQCFVDDFTKNGKLSMRVSGTPIADRTIIDGSLYNPDFTFQCGVIGYLNTSTGMCQVDEKLFPLYSLLCFGRTGVSKCLAATTITGFKLASMCQDVKEPYPPQYNIIHDVKVPGLAKFFEIFREPTTIRQHLDTVQCMEYIYGAMSAAPFQSRGLYIPFTFTVYEIPFPWFYQCMVGGGMRIPANFDRLLQVCSYYDAKNTISSYVPPMDGRMSDFPSYIFNVRGGYNETLLSTQVKNMVAASKVLWDSVVTELSNEMYGGGNDNSIPRCYTEKRWNLAPNSLYRLKLIETYVRPSCSNNARTVFLTKYSNERGLTNLTLTNIINELTTNGGNKLAQNNEAQALLSVHIRDFGRAHLDEQTVIDNLYMDIPPIKFDASLPLVTSQKFTLKTDQVLTSSGYIPYSVNIFDTIQPGCAERHQNVFTGAFESYDTDLQTGLTSRVDVCPLYTTGLFACAYDDIEINQKTYTMQGSSSRVQDDFRAYFSALYTEAVRRYNARVGEGNLKVDLPMQPLAWYEDEKNLFFGSNWKFDLTAVATYMNNIDPDTKAPIMCVAGNKTIDYNNCTDANYNTLKKHVESNFVKDAGTIIPDRHQLDWLVSREMMAAGAIFSFASTDRNTSKQFMGSLFDGPSVCQARQLSHNQRICSFTSGTVLQTALSVSPWLSGNWNPYDQCDVSELDIENGNTEQIDVQCYYNAYCPGDKVFDMSVPYYKNMPYAQTCKVRNEEKTTHINVDSRSPYNLCKHSLVEDTVCQHTQGMLGGTDGMPSEDAPVDGDLFTLHEFDKIPVGDGGPFGNVLLAGRDSDYGFVRFSVGHIGGHQLGLMISNGTMRVTKMPLKRMPVGARMSVWDTNDVREWVETWNASMDEDDMQYVAAMKDVGYVQGTDANGRPILGWDCPLRRRAYYSGGVKGFRPSLPSARRSHRLFKDVNGNRHAHPTQRHMDASGQFGRYLTTNGFCFCPMSEEVSPDMCSVRMDVGGNHSCSLFSTVKAIKGESWGRSHTFRPKTADNEYKTCSVQLDWPFVAGTLRDGSSLLRTDVDDTMWNGASDIEARRCHVLDRIPDFAYAYVSKKELRSSGFNTLDRGVCHTGRVQKRARGVSGRCVRDSKEDSSANIRCADGRNSRVERRKSKDPGYTAEKTAYYRRSCSRCTGTPVFKSRGGHPMKPESSFGVPYRVSAERVLSQDLREALCGGESACLAKLNSSAWKVGEFMRTYLENPTGLFNPGVTQSATDSSSSYAPKTGEQPDDSALWDRSWVYCKSKESLASGENCMGSIKKKRWRANKVHACYTTLEGALQGGEDVMARTYACELDGRLGNLCRVIQEAQSLVASANCMASGSDKCALQEFVYSPSTWETTNQAFVHQTVTEFYKRADGCINDTDCICGTDSALAALRQSNSITLEDCNAVPVVVFQRVLIAVRGMVIPMAKVLVLLVNILLNLILTMVSSGNSDAWNLVLADWAEVKRQASGATGNIGDLLFDLAFTAGVLGPWITDSLSASCNVLNDIYAFMSGFWCNLIIQQLPIFLGALKELGGWIDVGFGVVNDVFSVILHDFLPDAMMRLYQWGYDRNFQTKKFRQKQADYENRVKLDLGDPDGQKKVLTLEEKQQRALDTESRVFKNLAINKKDAEAAAATQVADSVGSKAFKGFAAAISLGITGYQLYETIQSARMIAKALENFPVSFTLFDFQSFYSSIDALLLYIDTDFTCYSMVSNQRPLQCSAQHLPTFNKKNIQKISPRATSCWAEAQQRQVGLSTLYACTATSTCCLDAAYCSNEEKMRMCGECPTPPVGVRTYGCNTEIQKCQCGLASFEVDKCVAQRDCGPSSSCSLLANTEDMSFGAIKRCTDCTVSPICLYGGSQNYGKCTCMSGADVKVDLCSSALGGIVSANPMRLCGYALDPGTYFSWSEISLVLCVNAISPVCSEVITDSGNKIFMPVSTRLRSMKMSYGGRRLLSADGAGGDTMRMGLPSVFSPDDPADDITPEALHSIVTESMWNHTSAPCGTLAHAYIEGKPLGPVDESTLHTCVYWRYVARQVIRDYNLSSLRDLDTFLMSPDDMAAAMGQRGVLEDLLRKPQSLLIAALYSPWLKPIRAIMVASHETNVSKLLAGWARRITNKTAWRKVARRAERDVKQTLDEELSDSATSLAPTNGTRMRPGRKLMGLWDDIEKQVKTLPYYPYARNSMANVTVYFFKDSANGVTGAQYWLRDAFALRFTPSSSMCAAVEPLFTSAVYVLHVLQTYYSKFAEINAPREVLTRLNDLIPSFSVPSWVVLTALPDISSVKDTGSVAFKWLLGLVGADVRDFIFFLTQPCPEGGCAEANRWTFRYLVETATYCDFENVMYCNKKRRDLVTSTLFAVILYLALSFVLKGLGLSSLTFVFFYGMPFFIVWLSIGVPPSCFPMIPTCLFDDVLGAIKSWLPSETRIPAMLTVGNSTNLRSCADLKFTSWEDPIAFMVCDMGFCDNLKDTSFIGGTQWKFGEKKLMAESTDADAYRLCTTVSAVYVVPAVLAMSIGVALASSITLAALNLLAPFVGLVWQVSVFNHGVGDESINE